MSTLLIAWSFYVNYLTARNFCVIHVIRKIDKPGFLSANADKITIAIVAAVIGAFAKFSFDILEEYISGDYGKAEISTPAKQEKQPSGEN